MRYLRLLLTSLLTCLALPATARQPLLQHFSTAGGLSSNVVYNAFQDSQGFIWFSTDHGVCRFDGHSVKTFGIQDGLPDNEVFSMYEDEHRRHWLVCYNQQPCYIRDDQVYTAQNDPLCRALSAQNIRYTNFFRDKSGNTCISGERIYRFRGYAIQPAYDAIRRPSGDKMCLYMNRAGGEYFITGKGITRVGPAGTGWIYAPAGNAFYAAASNDRHAYLFQDSANVYSLHILDFTGDSVRLRRKIPLPSFVYDLSLQPDSSLLCFTAKGLLRFTPAGSRLERAALTPEAVVPNRMLTDNEGNRWFCTLNDGVYMQHRSLPQIYNSRSGLHADNVISVNTAPDGRILAGFADGSFCRIGAQDIGDYRLPVHGVMNRVRFVYQTAPERFLAGSDRGSFVLTRHGHRVTAVHPDAEKNAFRDGNRVYLAGSSSAAIVDVTTDSTTIIWRQRTTAICATPDGRIWIGTPNGLYCSGGSGPTRKYQRVPALRDSRITCLNVDADGRLLVGTHTRGIFVLDRTRAFHLSTRSGLRSNSIMKLLPDSSGNIWAITDDGLDQFSARSLPQASVSHFASANGLPVKAIHDIAIRGPELLIATAEGIIALDQRSGLLRPPPPVFHFLSVVSKDSTYRNLSDITLPAAQNNLRISYTGVSFAGGPDIHYRYILEGSASSDTVYTDLSEINLSGMRPGQYTLLVWARAGLDGEWSPRPGSLLFTIRAPFWQSVWFIAAMLVLVPAAAYGLYSRRIHRMHRAESEKAMQRQRIGELELQALRAQINPHFLFNALNSIQHYYSQNDELRANYYMSLFARLIRKILHHSKSPWLPLQEELTMLKAYVELEQMRFKNAFSFELQVDPALETQPQPVMVPAMLIQPYVENAIAHGLRHLDGKAGLLRIACYLDGPVLCCEIEDNGVGIARSLALKPAGHRSMGLELNASRVETYNQIYQAGISVGLTDRGDTDALNTTGTLIKIRIPQHRHEQNHHTHRR